MIVLDTHTWLWWVSNPELLSAKAQKNIDAAVTQGRVFISSISAWEVAMLAAKGRLELTIEVPDWIAKSEALPFVEFVPVDNMIALKSVALPGKLHTAQADRIIIATTLVLGGKLVTKDEKIRNYPKVKTIW